MKYYTLKLDKVKRHKKEIELEAIINELVTIQSKINTHGKSSLGFLYSKICYVIMEYNYEKKRFSDVDLLNLKAAYKVFKEQIGRAHV